MNNYEISTVEQKNFQLNIVQQYILKSPRLKFKDVGFSKHSQHEEDGILLFIFALIGTTNKKCVEICAGDGIECNTANLIINHQWIGLLFDGDKNRIQAAINFYNNCKTTRIWPPKIQQAWITAENVNDLVESNGFEGEIDFLSLDIDGIDFWLWKALEVVLPRVVVLEFNHLWGPQKSVTVPYDKAFKAEFISYGSDYAGASLTAFVKLAREKGYKLIGTNAIATNAFFLRNDIEHPWLPEIDTIECFNHPRAKFGMEVRFQGIKNKNWQEV